MQGASEADEIEPGSVRLVSRVAADATRGTAAESDAMGTDGANASGAVGSATPFNPLQGRPTCQAHGAHRRCPRHGRQCDGAALL
eukprot:6917005-Alexandrium_andersonii.AAC.1